MFDINKKNLKKLPAVQNDCLLIFLNSGAMSSIRCPNKGGLILFSYMYRIPSFDIAASETETQL
ncbi:hypothetical protein BpHYR1_053809 [Brachionus plicatilis]|uniref:Uncharacterized protein n=1 Tax=Brachionus plicatilis TaxID=10195 RepID=A0A3M7TCN5_BRAPC|nr:hypothetical protein BpHYR1_053809 [Brachionus plicatilis]